MKINEKIVLKLCFMFIFFVTMASSFALQNKNDENSKLFIMYRLTLNDMPLNVKSNNYNEFT